MLRAFMTHSEFLFVFRIQFFSHHGVALLSCSRVYSEPSIGIAAAPPVMAACTSLRIRSFRANQHGLSCREGEGKGRERVGFRRTVRQKGLGSIGSTLICVSKFQLVILSAFFVFWNQQRINYQRMYSDFIGSQNLEQ